MSIRVLRARSAAVEAKLSPSPAITSEPQTRAECLCEVDSLDERVRDVAVRICRDRGGDTLRLDRAGAR